MSFVIAAPKFVTAAASDLANIGSSLSEANGAAAAPTTGMMAADADEVSAAITSLFNARAQGYVVWELRRASPLCYLCARASLTECWSKYAYA
jgi:hypothetical protein